MSDEATARKIRKDIFGIPTTPLLDYTFEALELRIIAALKEARQDRVKGDSLMESIDRKFKIIAVCHAHGHAHTEFDGVFFKAGDLAFNQNVLDAYKREAIKLGAHPRQIEGINLLAQRVQRYKDEHPEAVKVPDVDPGTEEEIVNRPNEE